MDWSNERYVRLYTRDTATWRRLGWEGQSLLCLMLRKVDRAGVIDGVVDAVDDLILMTGLPPDAVEVGYKALVRHKVIVVNGDAICLPNFLEAQETPKSDAQRQRDCRESRRAGALLESRNVTGESQPVTNESRNVTDESRAVTPSHGQSQCVTPTLTDPNRSDPNRSDPNQHKNHAHARDQKDFEIFWKAYPKKAAKKDAKKAWGQVASVRPDLSTLLEALRIHSEGRQWQDGVYPHAATWLRGERWNDEPEKVAKRETPQQRARREQIEQAARWVKEAEEEEKNNDNEILHVEGGTDVHVGVSENGNDGGAGATLDGPSRRGG